jgi:hypothetical protein
VRLPSIVVVGIFFNTAETACPADVVVWEAKAIAKAKKTFTEVLDMKAP